MQAAQEEVEMSQAMRRFGSKVTMIDRNGRLMSKEDPDVCEALRSLLADEGIDILLNARIKQVSGKCGDSVSVVEQNGIEKVLKGSHCANEKFASVWAVRGSA